MHWVNYRRGNRTLRGFMSCIVVAVGVFLALRLGAELPEDTSAAVSAGVGVVLLVLWYLDRRERESAWLFAAAVGWLAVAVFVFHRGLRNYTSASS